MSFSVNTNNNALAALQTLNQTGKALSTTQARINTGLKIAGAKDDASTFAIAQGMRGDIAGFKSISDSLGLGDATVSVALNAAQTISDTLTKIKAKVVQAQDSTQDRAAIQNDIKAFIDQVDATASAAQFNGVNLLKNGASDMEILSSLNRSGSGVTPAYITVAAQDLSAGGSILGISGIDVNSKTAELKFSADAVIAEGDTFAFTDGAGNTTTFEFVDIANKATYQPAAAENKVVFFDPSTDSFGQTLAKFGTEAAKYGFSTSFNSAGNMVVSTTGGVASGTLTLATATTATASVSASADPSGALGTIETAITNIKGALSKLGTASNQIGIQKDFVSSLTDTLTGGVGQLVDADLAAESAQLQALQTKQQLGIQALSIANQGPGAVLSLFR